MTKCGTEIAFLPRSYGGASTAPCGEPIAQVGETWEHVDPKGRCAQCGLAEDAYEEGVEGLAAVHHQEFESGDHEFEPPVVERGHPVAAEVVQG